MNLKEKVVALCKSNNITVRKLEMELGIANGSVRRWDTVIPSADKLLALSKFFNVSPDYLLGNTEDGSEGYYYDPEVQALAQELKDRPELKVLFDASRGMSKETIEALVRFIDSNK